MNKPLGYYTSYTPGDGSVLDHLEQKYGSNFQKFNNKEKLYILCQLADPKIWCYGHRTISSEAMKAATALEDEIPDTKVQLIRFLADNAQSEPDEHKTAAGELRNSKYIDFMISEEAAFCLISQLEFAFRHPNNVGPVRILVREAIQPMLDHFTEDIRQILAKGLSHSSEVDSDLIPEPDPAWDYYEIWQSLRNIKNKIDAALFTIADKEQASKETDKELQSAIESALKELEKVNDDLDAALVLYLE